MTVSRKVVVTYDARDEAEALRFENVLRDTVMAGTFLDGWGLTDTYDITNQAMSAEFVISSPEPLVEPSG